MNKVACLIVWICFSFFNIMAHAEWEFSSTDTYLFARQQSAEGDVLVYSCVRSPLSVCTWSLLFLKPCKKGSSFIANFNGNKQISTSVKCAGPVEIDGITLYHYDLFRSETFYHGILQLNDQTKISIVDPPLTIYESIFDLTRIAKVIETVNEAARGSDK